jgi:DNA-binding cell septation regulator SpoVG
MKITDVRIKLVEGNRQLKAFATIVIDDSLVIRDLKIIQGRERLFLSMPSREAAGRCPQCQSKNKLSAKFCNECGQQLLVSKDTDQKRYCDIAYPITGECRQLIEKTVLSVYEHELYAVT